MTKKVIEVKGGVITVRETSLSCPDHVIVAKFYYLESLEPCE